MTAINPGRAWVAHAFGEVVRSLLGRDGVSELALRDAWLEEIARRPSLTTNGWYDPPTTGAAILSCSAKDVQRSHFRSFRDEVSFSSE